MLTRFAVLTIPLIVILMFSALSRAQVRQPGAVYDFDRKGEKPAPAPRRDVSGIWEPANGAGGSKTLGIFRSSQC